MVEHNATKKRIPEDIIRDISYIRGWERSLIAEMSINEIYSLFETNKATDQVRTVISGAVNKLSKIREIYETELSKTQKQL